MITIFTPTYNRSHTLARLYQSLMRQTSRDFEWLIVDDGSTDGTSQFITSVSNVATFPVRYLWQPNKGKYIAYNNGLRNAQGEFFMCVDSDDWLPDDSIDSILSLCQRLKHENKVAGVVALKSNPDNKIIGKPFKEGYTRSGLYGLELEGQRGERSIVFKTSIARDFLFPEDSGEKFMPECVIYDRYEGKYDFIISNTVLTICEYQQKGLSSAPRRLMVMNPAGYKLFYSQRIDMKSSIIVRFINVIKYNAFRIIYGGSLYDYAGDYPLLVAIFRPLGRIAACYYRRKAE